ncbi:MAG TPA: DUF4440 domain-containing protein [Candidatus Acidoferrales bacterium]|nr:DUF4440 domain-containing protein [Candidatus Acidoferrales bacterium]
MKSFNWCGLLLLASLMLLVTNLAAASGQDSILQADHSLAEAVQKSNTKATAGLLDTDFVWTDAQGATHDNAATLKDLSQFAADNSGDSGKSYFYGELGLVYGTHHDDRFMRIWVKRPSGWRLFVDLDTPMAKEARMGAPRSTGSTGDCDNPCRTLPYKPATAADKAVLAEWQKTKVDEWHPNADDWATHIADEFMIINNGSARNKPERVALAKKEQAEGIGAPGAPILSMKMYDFGKAVVMISHHVPYQGGKPYYNVRVFVNRDGHWPLVWSQQTTIHSEAARPPVGAS